MPKKPSPKLSQLLAILNDGEFHDGTLLGQSLNMTRSAVWKMIKKLERYGVSIKSVKGKGYAIYEPITLLNDQLIRQQLSGQSLTLSVFETISSTNDYLKTLRDARGVQVCIAEQQTAGRGRLGREWYSPFAQNVYLSLMYSFHKDLSELAGLSLVISLAILQTLQEAGLNEGLLVKWPNDVLCHSKKIAGTLIDVQAESHGLSQVIIGVGLNVNMLVDAAAHIVQPFTSLRQELGKATDRNKLCVSLIHQLLHYMNRFNQEGFGGFVDEWLKASGMQGQAITLNVSGVAVAGQVVGINQQGHLIMKLADGTTQSFSSGDVSIMKC